MPGGGGDGIDSNPQGNKSMSDQPNKTPECPFNGVIIARDVKMYAPYQGEPRSFTLLAILRDDELQSEKPEVYFHQFSANSGLEPKSILRKGHRVKIRSVKQSNCYMEATKIDFDPAQLVELYRGGAAKEE
jgi:hypothetical protein